MLAQEFAQEFIGPEVQWFALTPLLVLLGGGLGMMVLGALTPPWPRGLYALTTAVTAGTAGVLSMVLWDDITDNGTATLVGGALAFDTFAQFVTIIVCLAVILVALVTDGELGRIGQDGPEVYALYLMAAIGAIVMGASNDFIVLFLGLETLSLALYVLAALDRRRTQSQEAGIKYLVLGGFASAFFLYGIALLYGGTGSTNISEVVASFQNSVTSPREDALVLAGIALLIVGLAFKGAAVPFHEWAPDVYQGAPSQVTAFMASVGKAAAFAAMLRVLVIALPFHRDDWRPVIWALAALSLVIGSALAAVQSNVKRMLAYSSISHADEDEPGAGVPSVLVYLLLYSVLVIGSFAVVTVIARNHDGDTDLASFAGLASRRPALALALTVFLLAQAGVPFTTGFIAKFGVIQAAVDEQSYAIAIIAMLAAVIAAFMYLRIMVSVWLQAPEHDEPTERVPFGTGLAIGAAAIFTIAVGIVPGWLIDAADTVTQYAR
jgi:NADH-quinone oxidoreductase subunit N